MQLKALAASSGINGKIAFESKRDGNTEIYVMDSDGSNQVNLTNHPADDIDPTFSPDGLKIAFASSRDGNIEVYVMNADGSNPTNLTNHSSNDFQPAFSPDGTKIVFSSNRGGNRDIYIMNVDGTNLTRLTEHPLAERAPSFSPDGTKITFRSDRDGNPEVYIMNADGTNQVNLSNNPAEDFVPVFSPDGTKIAFTTTRDGNDEIYNMNIDGTDQTNITNSPLGDNYPAYSPDGTKITYRSARDGNREIYVMNADGTEQTRLTFEPAEDLDPDWGPAVFPTTITPPTNVSTLNPTETLTSTQTGTPTVTPTIPLPLIIPDHYQTIQEAIDAADPGDTILVRAGIYYENLILNKSVTLTAESYDPDDPTNNTTIIDGSVLSLIPTIDVPSGVSPMPIIRGFVIQNGNDGIKTHSEIIVEYNYFVAGGDQLDYGSSSGGINHYNVYYASIDDAIDLDNMDGSLVIENNRMLYNADDGIEIRLQDLSAPIVPITITIQNNEIIGCNEDGIQIIDDGQAQDSNRRIIINNNLIANCRFAGIGLMPNQLSNEDYSGADIIESIRVYNNTLYGNDYGISGGDNLVAFNNIIANSATLGVWRVQGPAGANSVAAHTLFYNNGTDADQSNLGAGNLFGLDPLFAYPPGTGPDGVWGTADDDFSGLVPYTGSPSIDTGVTQYFANDGEAIPPTPITDFSGAAPDLGWREFDPNLLPTPTATVTPTATPTPAGFGMVVSQVNSASDDAEEAILDGSVSLGSSDLELGADGATDQWVGMRFNNITIPQGAAILSTYIEFEVDQTDSGSTSVLFQGQAADNALTFSNSTNDISSRLRTTASVPWNDIPPWIVLDAKWQTPDLSPIVQEIVNRSGWASGNSIVLVASGTGRRTAESYNGEPPAAPKLVITYTTGNTPTPMPTPGETLTPTSTITPAQTPTPIPTLTPVPGGSIRFAVIGDYGVDGTGEGDVAALVKGWNPDFIITTGDNNYPLGEAATIDNNIGQYYHDFIYPYSGSYGFGATTNRFFPSLGNHDWHTTDAQPYLDYFTLPGNERYYDFSWGPVHFFAVDSDVREPDGNTDTSTQGLWLQSQLAASTSPWNLVYMHHPPYSSGTNHGSTPEMQWPYQAWGADAVLSGHDHTYERIVLDGLPYFVNGLGGVSAYTFGTPLPGSEVRFNGDFGAMLVEASDSSITFQFITRTGIVIDTYSLDIISTPTPASTATQTITQTPVPTTTPLNTPSPTATYTPTAPATITPLPTATITPTITPLPTATPTFTDSPLPTATSTNIPTDIPLPSATFTQTNTPLPTATPTFTDTPLPTATSTNTPTDIPLPSATYTQTNTPLPTATQTFTDTPLLTATSTITPSITALPTATPTFTFTNTPLPSATYTPTNTPTITVEPGISQTFIPLADSYVRENVSTKNFGDRTPLWVDAGPNTEAYMRFTISGTSGPIQSAVLRVYAESGTVDGPAVYAVDNAWTESGITWNTKPAVVSGLLDSVGAISRDNWIEYDVTAFVTGNGTYSFVLSTNSTDGVSFSSREGSQPPELVVTSSSGLTPTASQTFTPTHKSTPTAMFTQGPSPTPSNTPLPMATSTLTPTNTLLPTNTPTSTSTNIPIPPTPTNTPPPIGGDVIYISSTSGGTAGSVVFGDEDILKYETTTGTWSLYFDGSDVGLGASSGTDVSAFRLLSDGTILFSFISPSTISGIGNVDDSDIVRFIPTSLGELTAGIFEWYFDGSDVGLTTSAEDIDAVGFAADGRLLISTRGSFSVAGISGNDEDLIAFTPSSLGSNTAGTWALYFDGSDVGLGSSSEDIIGASVDPTTGKIYLTTLGNFSVPGVSGTGGDIFICTPDSLGSTTSCTFSIYWVAADNGFGGEVADGIGIE